MPQISATRCKKFNSMNILQNCPSYSDSVAESALGYPCNILVSQSLQHQKEASVSKNVPRVAALLNFKHFFKNQINVPMSCR